MPYTLHVIFFGKKSNLNGREGILELNYLGWGELEL